MDQLNRTIPLPLYYQLKQTILRQVQSGELSPGDVIPTEKELEARFGVSRITVRRALADLVSEGYLHRQSGKGTVVLHPKIQTMSNRLGVFFDELSSQGFHLESKILVVDRLPVPRGVATKLQVPEGTLLFTFRRLVHADGEPTALSAVYLNLGENVILTREELEGGSIYPLLETKYGISLHRAQKTIEAAPALDTEAQMLGILPNAPVLLAEWLVEDDQGHPVIFMKAVYRGDRYKSYSVVSR